METMMKITQAIRSRFWLKMAVLCCLSLALSCKSRIEAQQISALPAITSLATNDLGVVVDVSATPPVSGTTKRFNWRQVAELLSTNNMPALITTGRVDAARLTVNTNGTEALILVVLPSGEAQILNGAGGNINFFSDTGFEFNQAVTAPSFVGSAHALTNFPPQVLFTNYAFVSASGFVSNPQVGNTWKPYATGTDARDGLIAAGFTEGVIYFLPGNYAATSLTATNFNLYFARGATAPTLTLYNTLTNTIYIDGNGVFTNDMTFNADTVLSGDAYGTGILNQSLIVASDDLTINVTDVKLDVEGLVTGLLTVNAENLQIVNMTAFGRVLITAGTINGNDFFLGPSLGTSVINCNVIDADSFGQFVISDSGVGNVSMVFNVASIINQSAGQELSIFTTGGFSVSINFGNTVMDLPIVTGESIPGDGIFISGSRFIR